VGVRTIFFGADLFGSVGRLGSRGFKNKIILESLRGVQELSCSLSLYIYIYIYIYIGQNYSATDRRILFCNNFSI
jgi:hypothetical protein